MFKTSLLEVPIVRKQSANLNVFYRFLLFKSVFLPSLSISLYSFKPSATLSILVPFQTGFVEVHKI